MLVWKRIFQKIFSVKNNSDEMKVYKNWTVFGFKIKIRNYFKEQKMVNEKLLGEAELLRTIVERSIDITKIPPATGKLRKIQLIKTKMLELIDITLKKHNIQYWLDYGTLIGAIRHKGFIPWDDDIDVVLLKEDYLKLPEVFKDLEKLNLNLKIMYGNCGYDIIRFCYKDFCVDFFPMEYINEKCQTEQQKRRFEEKWLKLRDLMLKKYPIEKFVKGIVNHIGIIGEVDKIKNEVFNCQYKQDKSTQQMIRSVESMVDSDVCAVLDAQYIYPLKECQFENLMLPIPSDPIEHLYQCNEYGDRGSVMNFPRITNSGCCHSQNGYEALNINLDEIYNEISQIVENFSKGINT